MRNRLSLLVSFLALPIYFLSTGMAAEPEEVWRDLAKSSSQERQKLILTKAKAEGEVAWYTTLNADLTEPLKENFERHYPGIQVKIWRGRGEGVAQRLSTEARAGKYNVDVVSAANEYLAALMKADVIGRYNSPERNFYSDDHKDRDGYWTSVTDVFAVIAYNTRLVSKVESPKRYEDFLVPRWKGRFAIDSTPDRAVMGWIKAWGTEKTEKFLQALIKNGAVVRSGHLLTIQLLCAGEFHAGIELYVSQIIGLKQKGCPVEMVFPNPTPGAVAPLGVARRAPHPYAAALWVDYLLSEDSQRILVGKKLHSGRVGMKIEHPDFDLENLQQRGVRVVLLNPLDVEQLGKPYLDLRTRYLLNR
jgi:iron(III) transport system substrate-binding protein